MNHNMTLLSGAMPVTVELESLHKLNLVLLLKLIDHIGEAARRHQLELGLNSRVTIEQKTETFEVKIKPLDHMPQTYVFEFGYDRDKLSVTYVPPQKKVAPYLIFALFGKAWYASTLGEGSALGHKLREYSDLMIRMQFDGSYCIIKDKGQPDFRVTDVVSAYIAGDLPEMPEFDSRITSSDLLERLRNHSAVTA